MQFGEDSIQIDALTIEGETFRIAKVKDPEFLFKELLKKDNNHPDVKDERIPYWAELWPSAIGLAGFILSNKTLVKNKRVLEIGCGLGLPGIACGRAGGKVTMTDYEKDAITFAAYNWKLNSNFPPSVALLDWRHADREFMSDVLIASDIAYESKSFPHVIAAFKKLVKRDGLILLSEPNRKLASGFFKHLEKSGFSWHNENRTVVKDGIRYSITIYSIRLG